MVTVNTEKLIGVYTITNKVNNKKYVGSSINIAKRRSEHFRELEKNRHFNKHLQNAYNKHSDFFEFEVIYLCETIEEAMKLESLYIQTYDLVKNGYNQTYRTNFNKDYYTARKLKGNKLSDEHKEKLKGPRSSMQGRKHHATKPFYQYDKNFNLICIWYDGVEAFAKKFNMVTSSVRACLEGTRNSCYGNIFSYKPLIEN